MQIKQVSLEHINQMLQEIDVNYPFSMLGLLIIITCILGTLVVMILCGTVSYLKYRRAQGMVGYLVDIF